jgi:hypothetical protein
MNTKVSAKYLALLSISMLCLGCEQLEHKAAGVGEFFRPPPVLPMLEVIQTSLPTGFCATVAMADQLGHRVPGSDIYQAGGNSLIHLINNHEYPLSLLAVPCDEIYILRLQVDEEICIISAFFVTEDRSSGQYKVYTISPVPVLINDGRVMAILARNNIYVQRDLNLQLEMSQGKIDIEVEKLKVPRPENVSVAIEQNAWIIDIDPYGTWNDFTDDVYTITGGEQDVSTVSDPAGNAANILQLAMIEITVDPGCLRNPVSGFAVHRETGIKTARESQLDDLILGTILYTFNESCTGKIKVPVATGSFLLSTGQEVDFNMMDR